MFKSAFCYVFDGDLAANLEQLKRDGFDGVEFWHRFLTDHDIDHVAAALEGSGLECAQVCPYF